MTASGSGVWAGRSTVLDRWIQLGIASGKVIKVDVVPERAPAADGAAHPVLDRLLTMVDDGEPDDLRDVEIGLTVDTDHRAIYRTLRELPYGERWTVGDLVGRTPGLEEDEDGRARARSALAGNPVPIVVPDHRIDDVDGALDPDVRAALRARERR